MTDNGKIAAWTILALSMLAALAGAVMFAFMALAFGFVYIVPELAMLGCAFFCSRQMENYV